MRLRNQGGRSIAERVTLALSLLVIGGLVFIALREESLRQEGDGAGIEVTFDVDNTRVQDQNYYVPYTIENTGSQAIMTAEIWFEMYEGGRMLESAEVTVQFLPLKGTQDGVYVTRFDPATRDLRGRLESMQFP